MGAHQHPERPEGGLPAIGGPVDVDVLELASRELLKMIDLGSKTNDFVSVPSAGIAVPSGQMLRVLKQGLEISLAPDVTVEDGTRMMEAQLSIIIQLAQVAVAAGTINLMAKDRGYD